MRATRAIGGMLCVLALTCGTTTLIAQDRRPSPAPRAAATPVDPLGPEVHAAMDAQDRLVAAGRLDELVRVAEEGARAGTADSYYLLGRAHGNVALHYREQDRADLFQEHIGRARDAFEEARSIGELVYAPSHLGLARCARFAGELDEAIRELRRALDLEPSFKAAVLELAQTYLEKRLHQDAELVLIRFLESHPRDTEARLLLGIIQSSQKHWSEAEREFRQVLQQRPNDTDARKMLASSLMFQERYEDAAREFESVRRANAAGEDVYVTLFELYRRLRKKPEAEQILREITRRFPGTEAATRAAAVLEELRRDPNALEGRVDPRESIVERLKSADPKELESALREMQEYDWEALPADVYRVLSPDVGSPLVRQLAVKLIGDHGDIRTLTLLEILLSHPEEKDPAIEVRRAAARAIAGMKSDAVVALLYPSLDDPDMEIREAAVRGIADRTGKYFRTELATATPAAEWGEERQLYHRWWNSDSASIAKRRSLEAIQELFLHLQDGRKRLTVYALMGMRDRNPTTWRVGYDLFRKLSYASFGYENGDIGPEERGRVTRQAENWYHENF